jgi:hypothetical protein
MRSWNCGARPFRRHSFSNKISGFSPCVGGTRLKWRHERVLGRFQCAVGETLAGGASQIWEYNNPSSSDWRGASAIASCIFGFDRELASASGIADCFQSIRCPPTNLQRLDYNGVLGLSGRHAPRAAEQMKSCNDCCRGSDAVFWALEMPPERRSIRCPKPLHRMGCACGSTIRCLHAPLPSTLVRGGRACHPIMNA